MASSTARPVVPVDSALVAKLHEISAVNSKLIKSSVYAAPANADIKVRSWKMDEFKYYDVPSPFPTLARGIFTVELPKDDESKEQEYRIVARGYDKFFNIGEVPWTTWPALEEHTAPPYTLSLKSNGCIIFIAALTPTQLVVTSKHSVGPTPGQSISHAQAGEGWLRKYFEQKGKTEADLAGVLWENNWTAVAELCDDSFEEHVLPYPPHLTGLHLHGLNTSTSTFHTLPQPDVDAFATEWGFIRTASITLPTIAAVQEFTAKCGETGSWEGEAVEGFVVRTHVAKEPGKAPYKAGDTFFFKVKFDEPYMMYRDWREVTKTLLRLYEQEKAAAAKGISLDAPAKGKKGKKPKPAGMSYAAISPHKLRRPETRAYVRWVIPAIRDKPELFAEFNNNKGIIASRERFLEYLKTPEGVKLMEEAKDPRGPSNRGENGSGESGGSGAAGAGEQKAGEGVTGAWGKTIIVPVGVPGCGKTALAVALLHIFGPTWGHTQSDDVRAKKPAPIFLKNVTTLLGKKEVVIADKNNHLRMHRSGLRAATTGRTPRVRLVALNWAFSNDKSSPSHKGKEKSESDAAAATDDLPTLGEVHRICAARVTQRGANHQTLRASSGPADATQQDNNGNDHHERIIWRFLHSAEALAPDEVDDVIEMRVGEGLAGAVQRAVAGIVRVLVVPAPMEERVKEGVEKGEQYAAVAADAAGKKANASANGKGKGREATQPPQQQKKVKPPRYYGFLPALDLAAVLTEPLKADAGAAAFLAQLIRDKRVAERPHVTIVHSKSLEGPNKEAGSGELWEKCRALDTFGTDAAAGAKQEFRLKLGSVLWNERVMAITVEDVQPASEGSAEGHAQAFLTALPESVHTRLHVTVGTRDSGVKPVEAKGLVEAWRMGGETGMKEVKLEGVSVQGRVRGMFS
ncbi:RNA ligase [Mycena metata]|uniref:RNA ligase n=1 Tax=Mycena metata TaxID=1033252 RepID=A0AAD7IXU4_9AGAR|nr:RNA ligase [Mycena metata]